MRGTRIKSDRDRYFCVVLVSFLNSYRFNANLIEIVEIE